MNKLFDFYRGRRFVSGTSVLLVIAACAPPPVPSDREIKTEVTHRLAEPSDIVMVRNVKKTKITRKENGAYVADVDYDVVFKMSFPDAVLHLEARSDALTALTTMQPLLKRYGAWEMCQSAHEHASFPFVKSEKGWVIANDISRSEHGGSDLPD
jgi:hypothetical protein